MGARPARVRPRIECVSHFLISRIFGDIAKPDISEPLSPPVDGQQPSDVSAVASARKRSYGVPEVAALPALKL